MKKEVCFECGQEIDREKWLKHKQNVLKKQGLKSLAKALKIVSKKNNMPFTLQDLIKAVEKAKVRNYDITADEVNYFIDADILLAELKKMEE